MKCLTVFSKKPELLYISKDKQFEKHLIQNVIKQQLIDTSDPNHVLDDIAMLSYAEHFFCPLISSNMYMSEIGNSYKSIRCKNGFIFIMKELSNLYFVAVCGDGEESELFLQRKINVFDYLLRLYFGPCVAEQVKPEYPMLRKQRWNELEELMNTWHTLANQEQMFLVEAIERLHVNQHLNSVSLNLLGDVLQRTNRDGHTVHAMLLVNNKLLGLYSNEFSPELCTSDILMLIVIVKNRFKYSDDTVPSSLYRTPPSLSSPSTNQTLSDQTLFKHMMHQSTPVNFKDTESETSSNNLKYHSAPSTPPQAESFHTPSSSSYVSDTVDEHDLSMNEADLELLLTSTEENEGEEDRTLNEWIEEQEGASNPPNDSDHAESTEVLDEDEEILEDFKKEETSCYFQKFVFLQAGDCKYTPHIAHCLLLDNATVLIIISQSRHISLASIVQKLLSCFHKVLTLKSDKVHSTRVKLFDDAEKCVKKILNASFKHADLKLESERLLQSCRQLERSWKLLLDAGFSTFIRGEETAEDMSRKLELCLLETIKVTKSFFTYLFISHTQRRLSRYERQLNVILNVRDMAVRRLNHFSMYLQVRGQRNVTMTAYHNDFPGLVHFIYVNRGTDQLIAPTINVSKDSRKLRSKLPIYIVIKQRIWDLWQYAENMVLNGFTSLIVRDGDFCYSYFLWFEDLTGKPLSTSKTLKELYETNPTGVMSGSFYKNIIRHLFPSHSPNNVNCFELLCMHIGAVNNHFVATSCRKLTRFLWDASGEANSSMINLL